MDIGGEPLRAVSDTLGALKARAGGANEPGRQGGRRCSITTASTPASFSASAAQIPAAPAPMISSGTRASHFPAESKLTALMTDGAFPLPCH